MMRVLVTGTAGFIGFHLARLLLKEGLTVHSYDGMTDYHDVWLKKRRHQMLLQSPNFTANEGMLENAETFDRIDGPWGRPDLELYKFVDAILDDHPIDIYNHGDMYRDFTYVDDPVRGIRLLIDAMPERPAMPDDIFKSDSLSSVAPFCIVNIGNSDKGRLLYFVDAIEDCLGKKTQHNFMDKGDVPATWVNTDLLHRLTGYCPQTDVCDGIEKFVAWFREYHGK